MLAVSRKPLRDAVPAGGSAHRFQAMADETQKQREPSGDPVPDYAKWAELVRQVRAGDDDAMEKLYSVFASGVRFYLCRQLHQQDVDDKVHDTFLIVLKAIRKGDLREPERLMGFVRTVARRQVAAYINKASQVRREDAGLESASTILDDNLSPEERAIARQRTELLKEVLTDLSERDREILSRFYVQEQTQQQICAAMDLSETQFRLLKSRAKSRFGEIGKRKLARRSLSRFLMRFSASGGH